MEFKKCKYKKCNKPFSPKSAIQKYHPECMLLHRNDVTRNRERIKRQNKQKIITVAIKKAYAKITKEFDEGYDIIR